MWYNPLEEPWLLLIFAAVDFVFVWIISLFNRRNQVLLLVPIMTVIIAVCLDAFVMTPREHINAVFQKGSSAYQKKQIEPVRQIIADDYSDTLNTDKELIIAFTEAMWQTAPVEKITVLNRQIEAGTRKGSLVVEAMVKFAEGSEIAQHKPFMLVKMKFLLEDKGKENGWQITGSEMLELDRKSISWQQLASVK